MITWPIGPKNNRFSLSKWTISKIAPSHLPKRGDKIEYRRRLRSRNDYPKIQNTFGILSLRSSSPNSTNENVIHFPQTTSEQFFVFTQDDKRTVSIWTLLTDDENNVRDDRHLITLGEIIGDHLRKKIHKEKTKRESPIVDHNITLLNIFACSKLCFTWILT
jgi:hypothetical protein